MSSRAYLAELWPATGVRIRSGDLELRWIDDDLLASLAEVAARGVHDAASMPFNHPWTRDTPAEVARSVLAFQWSARTRATGTGDLALELGVLVGGVPVGVQSASGRDWRVCRSVETGSWLGREFHGRGIGSPMRAALAWAFFDGLGARQLTSSAFVDNPASLSVSRRIGYEPNGVDLINREGTAVRQQRFLLTRERWEERRQEHLRLLGAPVELTGFEALRAHLD